MLNVTLRCMRHAHKEKQAAIKPCCMAVATRICATSSDAVEFVINSLQTFPPFAFMCNEEEDGDGLAQCCYVPYF